MVCPTGFASTTTEMEPKIKFGLIHCPNVCTWTDGVYSFEQNCANGDSAIRLRRFKVLVALEFCFPAQHELCRKFAPDENNCACTDHENPIPVGLSLTG